MALVFDRVREVGHAVVDKCTKLRLLLGELHNLLAVNSSLAIDWGAGSTPAYITEEESGNLSGEMFARQDIANAIGTFAAIEALMAAGHEGNINKLARA